ncbi:MAG: hypothetical protein CMJ81_12345 [Planctomycetaceae bacterium]|jgi:hypothetical protein|nr:hypothetical protein [Planctomycetaceae bacterium]MBP63534.1 hypothetical protein [Planctomycetaceae bacterium]
MRTGKSEHPIVLLGQLQRMKGVTACVVTIANGIASHTELKNLWLASGYRRLPMRPADTKVLGDVA